MTSLDDLPLDTGRRDPTQVTPSAPSSPGPRIIVVALLVAAVLGASVWFYLSRGRVGQPAATAAGSAAPGGPQAVSELPVATALPPLDQMDPYVRELFATLGAHPELAKWLVSDDLVGSIATAIDRLAQGQSPSRDLAVLKPSQGFATARGDGTAVTSKTSYARYAPVVDAVAAVDPARLAAVFTTLRPRLEEAYVRQGHPEGGFDQAVRRAIDVVATTPEVPADAALVSGKGGYAYADPAFEQLPPAQKHLIRMGPEHTRRVRDAARRFGEALPAATTTR